MARCHCQLSSSSGSHSSGCSHSITRSSHHDAPGHTAAPLNTEGKPRLPLGCPLVNSGGRVGSRDRRRGGSSSSTRGALGLSAGREVACSCRLKTNTRSSPAGVRTNTRGFILGPEGGAEAPSARGPNRADGGPLGPATPSKQRRRRIWHTNQSPIIEGKLDLNRANAADEDEANVNLTA